ncbi:MAG: hypothetical protein AB8B67_04260 [Rickettsiaceae bacterium]
MRRIKKSLKNLEFTNQSKEYGVHFSWHRSNDANKKILYETVYNGQHIDLMNLIKMCITRDGHFIDAERIANNTNAVAAFTKLNDNEREGLWSLYNYYENHSNTGRIPPGSWEKLESQLSVAMTQLPLEGQHQFDGYVEHVAPNQSLEELAITFAMKFNQELVDGLSRSNHDRALLFNNIADEYKGALNANQIDPKLFTEKCLAQLDDLLINNEIFTVVSVLLENITADSEYRYATLLSCYEDRDSTEEIKEIERMEGDWASKMCERISQNCQNALNYNGYFNIRGLLKLVIFPSEKQNDIQEIKQLILQLTSRDTDVSNEFKTQVIGLRNVDEFVDAIMQATDINDIEQLMNLGEVPDIY